MELEHLDARGAGVRLHCVATGPRDGPLVLLLHGFPDCWITWKRQLAALGERGFRAVAPEMRGYGDSDKPRAVREYAESRLAADVDALTQHFGRSKAHVVGHDWGGRAAWCFAMQYPNRIDKLATLNVPHPVSMSKGLRTLRQLRKSWYFFYFQLPSLPETHFTPERLRSLHRRMLSEEDAEVAVRAMRDPRGPLNYYRAAARSPAKVRRIDAQTLVIFGIDDRWLGQELADPPPDLVPRAHVERVANAGHWVHADAPDRVNALLLDFLEGTATSRSSSPPPA
jgi:pimeloyl-ACP methyl ester carboxylesterase